MDKILTDKYLRFIAVAKKLGWECVISDFSRYISILLKRKTELGFDFGFEIIVDKNTDGNKMQFSDYVAGYLKLFDPNEKALMWCISDCYGNKRESCSLDEALKDAMKCKAMLKKLKTELENLKN